MRVTKGRVVGGQIVVEGEPLEEGSTVTILFPDDRTFRLSDTDEAELLAAMAEADRGENVNADDLLSELRNRR